MAECSEAIRLIECETAQEFLNALRCVSYSEENGPPHADQWAWRGQTNADWELVPTAFRPGNLLGYTISEHVRQANPERPNSTDQHRAEFYALYDFVVLADELGMDVPGDSQIFRHQSVYDDVIESILGTRQWPPHEILEVMAIAQHHGVPTRLIDFTSKASIAAYFAASSLHAKSTEEKNQRLAVWGINRDFLFMSALKNPEDSVTTVTVPRAHNKKLHQQHGLFLMDSRAGFDKPLEMNRAVEIIARNAWQNGISCEWLPMIKVTAPNSIGNKLLELLEVEGIDRPHLMPSFDEVVKELERRRDRLKRRNEIWALKNTSDLS